MLDLNDVPPLSDGAKPRVHTRPDWVSGGPRAEPSLDDALVAFRQAAAQRGVSLPPEIIIDGEIHRCDTTGKNGDGDAAYLFHADGLPAGGFQNWQDAIGWQDWHSDPGRPLTPAESDELRRKAEADKEKRLAAREARRADTAARAASIWEKAAKDPDHPYLDRKRVKSHGVRQQDRSNYLAVPMLDEAGDVRNLQLIDPAGEKRFLTGGVKRGTRFVIGDLDASDTILIGEGFSTVATAHQATGAASVVAFDAGNLLAVARSLRDQYPAKRLVLLADNDCLTAGNPGVTKATEAAQAVGASLAIPEFGEGRQEGNTDFNDLAAVAGLDQVRRQIEAASEPESIARTYEPPLTLDLASARAALARIMSDHVHAAVAWHKRPMLDLNSAPVDCINAPPGLGKTRTALEIVVPAALQAELNVLIAIPRHDLGDQQVRDLAAIGIKARTYRARGAPDPEARDTFMCRETERTGAIDGALGDISAHACKSAKGICEHYETCGYQRQKRDPPEVWLVAHQLLYRRLPAFIPQPDIVIIDEAFHSAGDQKDVTLDLNLLVHNRTGVTGLLRQLSEYAFGVLSQLREPCRLRRDMFGAISASDAREAYRLEWRRKKELVDVVPGMPRDTAIARALMLHKHNQDVAALAKFWEFLAVTLENEWDESLYLRFSPNCSDERGDKTFPGVVISSRLDLRECITGCSVVHLDGTMHEVIVQQFFPHATFHNINVRMPPMTTASLLQVTDRAFGKSAKSRKLLEEYRQLIEVAADDAGSGKVGVITLKDIEIEIEKGWTPPRNVRLAHYGDVTGTNKFSDVSDLILIGRPEPAPFTIEQTARLLFRRPVAELPAGTYYPEARRGMAMRDSDAMITLPGSCHSDPGVEALRWVACEGSVLQALHRARGINRTGASPLLIRIATNVCLPIEIDFAMPWEQMRPMLLEVMLARGGVGLSSYADMATAYPDLFKDAVAARNALAAERRRYGINSYKVFFIRINTISGPRLVPLKPTGSYREIIPYSPLKYRRTGAPGRAPTALFRDDIDPAEQLQELLGCEVVLLEHEP